MSETRDLQLLLTTVLRAITLPRDTPDRDQRMQDRADHARTAIRTALREGESIRRATTWLAGALDDDDTDAAKREQDRCGRCRRPYDPTDSRHNGRARHGVSPYCRSCISACHEATDAFHACPICDPTRYGGTR